MEKVCFTSFVYGWYQDFIPIFVYSTLKSYPQHFVRIFLYEALTDGNRRSLELIRNQVSDQFEIIESFTELDDFNLPHKAAYRFVMGREYFPEFEYIYIGDVDFIIQEKQDFFESHLNNCEKTGLPFSNSWNYDWGKFRACGLHFIIKTPYFDAMDKWIKIMKGQNKFKSQCKCDENAPTYDEEMLYYMLVHEFDLRSITNFGRIFPGVHLAFYRPENVYKSVFSKKNHIEKKEPPLIYERYEQNLRSTDFIIKTDLFSEIHKNMSEKGKTCLDCYLDFIS